MVLKKIFLPSLGYLRMWLDVGVNSHPSDVGGGGRLNGR